MDKAKTPSLLSLGLTALVIIVGLFYGIVALSTADPIWFSNKFDSLPEEIDLNCYGTLTTMSPGDDHFSELVQVVNKTLSKTKNFDSLTMSDETYAYYLSDENVVVVELIYTQKVRIHSLYSFFANLDSIVIPLVGRHSNTHAIFGRSNGFSTGGSLHYSSMPAVLAVVESSGLCPSP